MLNPQIVVAYSGVHQAFQMALAAHEMGRLARFYCSVFAARGKWGGLLIPWLGESTLRNRFIADLPLDKVHENPWPVFTYRFRRITKFARSWDWEQMNINFDAWVARRIKADSIALFVGVETCCAQSLEVVRKEGSMAVVDWPGIGTPFLDALAIEAADHFGITTSPSADTSGMRARKQRELELADVLLTCSEFHRRTLIDQGVPARKLQVIPLWVETDFWHPAVEYSRRSGPLRVMFAGRINVRKGIPYLVKAAVQCDAPTVLTLIGDVDEELRRFLHPYRDRIELLPPCSKAELRRQYVQQHVFVLPSLGDSFGFAALEAMACGLPVIVSKNCGVPVPDPSWRVPVMDVDAIASRLQVYAENRELCYEHGRLANQFAREYSTERYRKEIKQLYGQLLASVAT